jgi:putative transposase
MHDQLATGRRIRVLTIVDTFSRFSPAVDPRFSYKGEDVVLTLERICKSVGYPKAIRVDQGSKFISRDLDLWAHQKGVVLDFSRPGKPTDNCFIESFNGKLRAECLNTHWFLSLDDARAKMEDLCRDYNEIRPHRAIGSASDIAAKQLPGVPAGMSLNPGKFQPRLAQNRGALQLKNRLTQNREHLKGASQPDGSLRASLRRWTYPSQIH